MFVLYVSGTQEQADAHVQNIGAMLERPELEADDPDLSQRQLTKYGHSRGWRRNRLITEAGMIVDGLGLDVNVRGIKIDEYRPDLIVLDDIDNEFDTPDKIQKKIDRLTRAVLPAGSDDVAVLAIQNMVIPDGVFARLADLPGTTEKAASFLANRTVSGPIPAVEHFEFEERDGKTVVTGGTPTWAGMDLDAVQHEIDTIGLPAFLVECQHEVRGRGDKIVLEEWFSERRYDALAPPVPYFRIMSWDTAESVSASAAFTAYVVGDVVRVSGGHHLYIRGVWRKRVQFSELLDVITEHSRYWNQDGKLMETWLEAKSFGKAAIDLLRIQADPDLPPIRGYLPSVSKADRLDLAARPCRQGRVWLPNPHEDVPWLPIFQQELFEAPNADYQDQTDAFAQLILLPTVRTLVYPEFAMAEEAA